MAKHKNNSSKPTNNATLDSSAIAEPQQPETVAAPEPVASPEPSATPEKAEAPPEAKDKANEGVTESKELARMANEALVKCVEAYRTGERGYREGLLRAGAEALLFVSYRVRLGATRESAVVAINGMLAAHSTTEPDANGLIRSYIAFRELAGESKDAALEEMAWGHWANGWSMLVEGRAPVNGNGDRIYPEVSKEASDYFALALANKLPRESVVAKCRELYGLAVSRRVETERQEAKKREEERKAADADRAAKDKAAREEARKAEEAASAKEAADAKAEEAAKAALAAPSDDAEAKAKAAKDEADKAAERARAAKAEAERLNREKELADQKAALAKEEERKKAQRLCEAETAKNRLDKQREKQERKENGAPPAEKREPKPEAPTANLIGSAKDMRPDQWAKNVTDAILASGRADALISALLLAWVDSPELPKKCGPEVLAALNAAFEVLDGGEGEEIAEVTDEADAKAA